MKQKHILKILLQAIQVTRKRVKRRCLDKEKKQIASTVCLLSEYFVKNSINYLCLFIDVLRLSTLCIRPK